MQARGGGGDELQSRAKGRGVETGTGQWIEEEKGMVVSVLLRTTNRKGAGTDARLALQGSGDTDVKEYGDIME